MPALLHLPLPILELAEGCLGKARVDGWERIGDAPSLKGLSLSLPTTTGCAEPMTGGTLWPAPAPSG